ncbi:MAG: YSC84-related protein, partial [Thermoanaerobaculia bacterium]
GPVGVGAGASPTADFLVYTRHKGLFGGVDVEGAVVKPSEDYNNAYYGKEVTPVDILVKGAVHNKAANEPLLSKVKKLFGGK